MYVLLSKYIWMKSRFDGRVGRGSHSSILRMVLISQQIIFIIWFSKKHTFPLTYKPIKQYVCFLIVSPDDKMC